MAQVSWDETFADGYEEWSADMTADVGYVFIARRRIAGRTPGTGGS